MNARFRTVPLGLLQAIEADRFILASRPHTHIYLSMLKLVKRKKRRRRRRRKGSRIKLWACRTGRSRRELVQKKKREREREKVNSASGGCGRPLQCGQLFFFYLYTQLIRSESIKNQSLFFVCCVKFVRVKFISIGCCRLLNNNLFAWLCHYLFVSFCCNHNRTNRKFLTK